MINTGILLVISLVVLYVFYSLIRNNLKIKTSGKSSFYVVFIIGCDTGFGNLIVKKLSKLNCEVIAGCYTQSGLTEFNEMGIRTVRIDVTSKESINIAYDQLMKWYPDGLWSVICNAGIGNHSFFDMTEESAYRKLMEVNFFGNYNCIKKFLPLLRKKRGRLIVMTSMNGRNSIPGFGAYGASKAALVSLVTTLRYEMLAWGITVCNILPAGVNTGFVEKNLQSLSDSWNSAPKDIQEKYGSDWLKNQLLVFENYPKDLILLKPEKIVDAYIHACLALYPYSTYHLGLIDFSLHKLLTIMPDRISNYIICKIFQVKMG